MNMALMILGLIEQSLPMLISLATSIETALGGTTNPTNPATPIVTHLNNAHQAVQDAKASVNQPANAPSGAAPKP